MTAWMRTRTALITGLTGLLAAGLSACYGGGDGAPAQEEPAIDLAAEEAAVRQVNLTWLERFQARDAEGVAALFVEDGWTIGDDGLRDGRAAILADMTEEYEENPDATADWGAKAVWVAASGDLAVELQGHAGSLTRGADPVAAEGRWQQMALSWPEVVIGGGTPNIQKNIIAERILGLPKDP